VVSYVNLFLSLNFNGGSIFDQVNANFAGGAPCDPALCIMFFVLLLRN
jgi:hypothetical protein